MDIDVYQRNDFPFGVAVTDTDGAAVNLTGSSLTFTLKSKDTDTLIFSKLSLNDGITIDDATDGLITVNITHTDTDIDPGEYLYELLYVDANGKRFTTLQGGIRVIKSLSD